VKKNVSPAAAAVVIIALIAVVGFVLARYAGGVSRDEGNPPPTMPPEVAKEWEKWTGGQKGAAPGATGASMPGSTDGRAPESGPQMGGFNYGGTPPPGSSN
jgi:hypothetical protein